MALDACHKIRDTLPRMTTDTKEQEAEALECFDRNIYTTHRYYGWET